MPSFSSFTTLRYAVVAVLVLVVLHAVGWLAPVERIASNVLEPVQKVFVDLGRPNVVEGSNDELREEIARLTAENVRLREEVERLSLLENQQQFLEANNLSGVQVAIIGFGPEGDDQVLLLNKGNEFGIAQGQPVITSDGILVGTIQESSSGRSTVLLTTNTQTVLAGEVDNEQRSPGVVKGRHGLSMLMELIPQNEPIAKGNIIVTSSLDSKIPANLVIGEITEIHYVTGDLFQQASVRPLINVQQYRYLTVLATS